jgi:hypothetical protein
MNDYDLTRLNDKEFEALVADIISKVENTRVERFKPGVDQGVDGRFYALSGKECIIQCKHYAKSGYKLLFHHLETREFAKVRKLKPSRYIIATSVGLSRKNKQDIKHLFSPFVRSETDIYGAQDVLDLIALHRNIEEKHYKLWMSSSRVMERLLHNDVVGRSQFMLGDFNTAASKYVLTDNHNEAISMLDKIGTIIITGDPGIGKTTLANHICLEYVAKGFDFCFIERSISEAESLYREEANQIFYFDDFLGRNYFVALDRKDDSHITNFIRRISRDKRKRFVLTSRTTILNQGKRIFDIFHAENLKKNEYELNIKSLSLIDKANILYNHIWFGSLPEPFIDELYIDKRYKIVIKHKNYNPRLISFITDDYKTSSQTTSTYWAHVVSTLTNPKDIWDHAFRYQLDDYARVIVNLVAFNGKPITEPSLRRSFLRLANLSISASRAIDSSEFDNALKLAVGALINRKISTENADAFYDLYNPAVGDYLINAYRNSLDKLKLIFVSLDSSSSISNISSFLYGNTIEINYVQEIVEHLAHDCLGLNLYSKPLKYQFRLLSLFCNKIIWNENLLSLINNWAQSLIDLDNLPDDAIYSAVSAMNWMVDIKAIESNSFNWDIFFNSIIRETLSHDDYTNIAKLLSKLDQALAHKYCPKVKDLFLAYWDDQIGSEINEAGVLDGYLSEDDEDDAYDELRKWTTSKFDELGITLTHEEMYEIIDQVDIVNSIIENQERESRAYEGDENRWDRSRASGNEDDVIDDLFDRQ